MTLVLPFGANDSILAYTPLGMSSYPRGYRYPLLDNTCGGMSNMALADTPGGIEAIEALVTAWPCRKDTDHHDRARRHRFAGSQRPPRVRLRRQGFSMSEPQASSRPPTSQAPTTFRWTCCASTATRSSGTLTKRLCWCVAPVNVPRRPRRLCAPRAWPTCTSSTAASPPGKRTGFAVNRGAQRWDLERQVRLVAGSIVRRASCGSIAAPKLKWVAAAIGGSLSFAALTNTCVMGMALSKLPYNRGATCDAQTVVAQLVGSAADQKVG